MSWDALYEASPTDATYIADTDDIVRNFKTDIRTRVAKEHGFNLTESSPQAGHGMHLQGSARIFMQSYAPTANYVKPDDGEYGTGRVWANTSTAKWYVWDGSAWSDSIRVKYADSADYATGAGSAAVATNCTNAINSTYATLATTAGTSTYATNAYIIVDYVVPSDPSDLGSKGRLAWNSSYLYVCVDTNTWKRVAWTAW